MNNYRNTQDDVIETSLNTDVLVNAGAGSGKTHVLKEKIAKHLSAGEISTSELLVLTFTNNSAHDMKTKIIERVGQLDKSDKLSAKEIDEIKNAINSAHIQTFDSFAQEIVVSYAYKLNIPNTLFIGNDYVFEAKLRQIIEDIFSEKYQAKDQKFINLISSFNTRDDKKTKAVILDLYNQLQKFTPKRQKEIIRNALDNFSEFKFKEYWNEFALKWMTIEKQKIEEKGYKTESGKEKALAKLPAKLAEEMGEYKPELDKYLATKEFVETLLSIYYEIVKRMDEYKLANNIWTYNDIAVKALDLLTNPKYDDVAIEVRNKFNYIMVDEYQDTNDIQEEVIESLIKPKKDGTRSHLFCVGDAKQSIYGFRNANINIFFDREKKLSKQEDGKVIPMFYNFRSFGNVLDDINTIFKPYMTKEHGDIKYDQEGQTLALSPLHEQWHNDVYGLHIITTDKEEMLTSSNAENIRLWEAKAIIQDIKDKVDSGFKVYDDKIKDYRPCKYSDFYIIVRTKSNYDIYERAFRKAGIELNNVIASNLAEVNAIMLINSLIKALVLIESDDNSLAANEQRKHIFASIARSYICKDISYGDYGQLVYDDQYIYDSIKDGSYLKDKMWDVLKEFNSETKHLPFSKRFVKLLDDFAINKLLFLVGEVNKNCAKIESLYQIIQSIEQSGGTIKDFSALLDIISKHDIDVKDETVVDLDNAVTLMTIHQSKGLQNKIVYLPNSVNHLGGLPANLKPDYDFDAKYGILLPTYDFNDYRNTKDYSDVYPKGGCIYTLVHKLYNLVHKENKKEIDEHVRLFYVALTRAEQAIYIVGYPKCKQEDGCYTFSDKPAETLFHMLSYVWGYGTFPYKDTQAFPIGRWHYVDLLDNQENINKSIDINNIDDKDIEFKIKHKARASQLPLIADRDIMDQRIALGDDLHAIMERIDFNSPNLDFISNKDYKDTISKVLNMDLFKKELKGAIFYPEYEYYDDIYHTTGYIDLLAIKDGIYYIIDYKLFNIDKEEYIKQLNIYKRNIQRIFEDDCKDIKLWLVSLKAPEKSHLVKELEE